MLGDYGVSSSGSGGGGGGGGGGITTAYEVDFAALATQPIAGDGAVVIDGHNWIFANFANAASAGVVNGTGLQITCSGNSIWGVGAYTAPVIYSPLTDYGIELSEVVQVRIMMRYLVNDQNTNFENINISLTTPPIVAPEHITWRTNKFYSSGVVYFASFIEANGVGGGDAAPSPADPSNITDDVMGLTVRAMTMCDYFTGVYSGGFPANLRRRFLRSMPANSTIVTPDNNSDFNVAMSAFPNGGGTGLQLIVQNLKIEYWT